MRYLFRCLLLIFAISVLFTATCHTRLPGAGTAQYFPNLSRPSWLPTSNDTVAASTSPLALHYSPAENLEHLDIDLIEQSRDHLDIAMYAFTDQAVAQAIVDVAHRGIPVRIYRDRQQYEEEQARNPYIAQLFAKTKNISIRVKGSRELMHLKAWSNGAMLRDGSANWSPSGLKRQDNSALFTTDAGDIRAFEGNFNQMWSRRDNYVVQ